MIFVFVFLLVLSRCFRLGLGGIEGLSRSAICDMMLCFFSLVFSGSKAWRYGNVRSFFFFFFFFGGALRDRASVGRMGKENNEKLILKTHLERE
jgi:hypothetical protein